nr:vasopressin V1b receptor-like [Penaeus vannamei]
MTKQTAFHVPTSAIHHYSRVPFYNQTESLEETVSYVQKDVTEMGLYSRYLISEDLKANKLKHGNGYAVLRRSMPNSKSLSRAKIKTVKMTFCIILTFVACWTPYFVVHNIRIWSDYRYKISQPVIVFAETMALVNSVLNPILYGCFNLRMKQGLKDVCCRGSSMERNVCINSAFHSRTMPPIRTSLHIIIDREYKRTFTIL